MDSNCAARVEWTKTTEGTKMKNVMVVGVLVIMMAGAVWAGETNLVTFTNKAGRVFKDVRIVSVDPDGVVWMKTATNAGKVPYSDLDEATALRFGYDPQQAKAYKELKQLEKVHDSYRRLDAERAHAARERLKVVERTKMIINGRVTQVIEDGLLVNSGAEERIRVRELQRTKGIEVNEYLLNDLPLYRSRCLLTDYPKIAVDDDLVQVPAYPNGRYKYVAVNGGEMTVRKFTCDPKKVLEPADEKEMKEIKAF